MNSADTNSREPYFALADEREAADAAVAAAFDSAVEPD